MARTHVIWLHDVEGISRKFGRDKQGNSWQEVFAGENEDAAVDGLWAIDECPTCGCDIRHMQQERDKCQQCGTSLLVACMEKCSECGETVFDGWLCLDGGDVVCDRHVKLAQS